MAVMSSLKDRLRTDLTASMKARDEVRSSTLRMVLTAITNAEVAGKEARQLSDDEVVGVLSSEAKKRREAATAFDDGGRAEMADVVFPAAAGWCESEGTVTNSERRVQRVRKALAPPAGARDDVQILFDLA